MSIQPDMRRWRSRFAVCTLLAAGMLLLTGAIEVDDAVRGRAERLDLVAHTQQRWGRDMAEDFGGGREGWVQLATNHPAFLIRVSVAAE
ncbi:MAG: hypothetical protein KAI66_26770 [Lentisphaeria bacterium]|nr:hypothetical protein [Lentisphaeria bacterium]